MLEGIIKQFSLKHYIFTSFFTWYLGMNLVEMQIASATEQRKYFVMNDEDIEELSIGKIKIMDIGFFP